MRILIAEDEVTIARALKVMLERNKYAVDVVFNGKDALDYIRAASYDALQTVGFSENEIKKIARRIAVELGANFTLYA